MNTTHSGFEERHRRMDNPSESALETRVRTTFRKTCSEMANVMQSLGGEVDEEGCDNPHYEVHQSLAYA